MELFSNSNIDTAEESLIRLTEDVRIKLIDHYSLVIPIACTGFIVRCLRIKDYDVNKAALLVNNFAKSTKQIDDMLDKFQPKFYQTLFLGGTFTLLKSRDHLGRQVIVSRVGRWDPKSFNFDEAACAAMLLFSFTVGKSAETQRKGVVFVHDLTGFGMQHVKAMKPGRLTQLVGLMNDGSPGRIKGIHMIFHPKIFSFIYQLVKPFLKEKLAKRIQFHGDDLSSLHKHLNVQNLPISLGGQLEESESVDLPLLEELIKQETIHKYLKTYRVPTH